MKSKKVISILLMLGVISSSSIFAITNTAQAANGNITVTAYKASIIANQNGYQIDKYNGIQSEAWISDNEVLTLTSKGEHIDAGGIRGISYCSIYNLNTKEIKDFKDVNIDEFLAISPNKNYVLYSEARNIPDWESEEYKKAIASGEYFHRSIKLLNLSTEEITDVTIDMRNINTEFRWVSDNKVLINYYDKWVIADITGKVIEEASYKNNSMTSSTITGVSDVKDLSDKIYYTSSESGIVGSTLYSMDVKSKEVKKLLFSYGSIGGDKKGKTIILDNCKDNGKANSDGVFVNRTFGALIIDESGKILHEINLPSGRGASDYILSPDGSKAAYIEDTSCMAQAKGIEVDPSLKIIDTKTGNIKEIVKGTALNNSNPENNYEMVKMSDRDGNAIEKKISTKGFNPDVKWDSSGTSLSFIYGGNTYIVSFDN